jgi:hypothetical protein
MVAACTRSALLFDGSPKEVESDQGRDQQTENADDQPQAIGPVAAPDWPLAPAASTDEMRADHFGALDTPLDGERAVLGQPELSRRWRSTLHLVPWTPTSHDYSMGAEPTISQAFGRVTLRERHLFDGSERPRRLERHFFDVQ